MWYVVQAVGNEDVQNVCDKCRQAVPAGLAKDIFVPKYTCMRKFQGEWQEKTLPLFFDYFFVDTEQGEEVLERLKVLSRIAKPVC